jgi:hypothetical protein
MLKDCIKYFAARNQEKTFEIISQMEEFSAFAIDVQVLKEIYSMQGQVAIFYSFWSQGITSFKKYVNIMFIL